MGRRKTGLCVGWVAALLAGLVSSGPVAAASAPRASAPPPAASISDSKVIALTVQAAPGVPASGATAHATVRASVPAGFARLSLTARTSGPLVLRGPATASAPATPGSPATFDVAFATTGAGAGSVDVSVAALTASGATAASRVTHLWVLDREGAVYQSANGPTDALLVALRALQANGRLSAADFAAARDQALRGPVRETAAGGPAQPPATPSAAAIITTKGTILYTARDGSTHPVRRAPVEIRDHNVTVPDQLVTTVTTDDDGNYTATTDNLDSGGAGGRDIYIRVLAQGDGFEVTTVAADGYFLESSVHSDVADGATTTISLTSALDDAAHDTNGAFAVADAIVTGVDYTKRLRGAKFPDIRVQFPDATGTNFGGNVGHILRSDRYDWDVNLHEYGHFFADQSGIQDSTLGGDVDHSFDENLASTHGNSKDKGERLAWREGYATYFSITAQQVEGAAALHIPDVGDTHYTDRDEVDAMGNPVPDTDLDVETMTGGGSLGEDNEVSVLRSLWDLYDAAADTGDDRGVALGDATVYDTVRAAGAQTLSAGYDALTAGKTAKQVADIGCIFSEHKVAPKITAPADGSIANAATPPTLTWDRNGDGAAKPSDLFVVRFYDADFANVLFESAPQAGNTFTPTNDQWTAILGAAGDAVNVVVLGTQSIAPVTGPYTSCNIHLLRPKIDLVFAIDTTGSMGSYINSVVGTVGTVVDKLVASGADFRVGLVDYKDSDHCSNYDAVTDLAFSSTKADIVAALNTLPGKVFGGCDIPEDVLSGVQRAVNFPWRNGVSKSIIVMGDAPGIDPEPHSGLTSASVAAAAIAVDPAVVYPILVGSDASAAAFMNNLAAATGGTSFDSRSSNVAQALLEAIDMIIATPPTPPGAGSTSTTYDGPTSGDYHDEVTLGATVAATASGSPVPLAGQPVAFALGTQTCVGTTDGSGHATCTLTIAQTPGPATVKVAFSGDETHASSGDEQPFTITKEQAAVAYAGDAVVPQDGPASLAGVLTEDGVAPLPGRTLTLTIGSGGTAQSCTGTTDANGRAACTIDPVNQAPGGGPSFTCPGRDISRSVRCTTKPVAAAFAGDNLYLPASTPASVALGTYACTTTRTGSVSGNLVVSSGTLCLSHATVTGDVTVKTGASVVVSASSITGALSATGPAAVTVCGSTVKGVLVVQDASGFVLVGDGGDGTLHCGPNTLKSVSVTGTRNAGTEIGGNTVSTGVVVSTNTGAGAGEDAGTEVEANRIGGGLACTANAPAPVNDGRPNTVAGTRSGQCAGL